MPRLPVRIVPYDPAWPDHFAQLCDRIRPAVAGLAQSVEHVGSTSVPGLAAKPVIDLDVVLRSRADLPAAIARLAEIGYTHQGDLGIPDREAFRAALDEPPHNLYVCPPDSLALRNHLAFRDHLRAHAPDAAAYADLKRRLAEAFPLDVESYAMSKSDFVLPILARYGLSPDELRGNPTRPAASE